MPDPQTLEAPALDVGSSPSFPQRRVIRIPVDGWLTGVQMSVSAGRAYCEPAILAAPDSSGGIRLDSGQGSGGAPYTWNGRQAVRAGQAVQGNFYYTDDDVRIRLVIRLEAA